MKRYPLYIIMCSAVAFIFSSCGSTYSIKGSSDVSNLDGQKLYLTTFKNEDMVHLDSCDFLHGQFKFSGTADSVALAYVAVENMPIMPLILEDGEINISFNSASDNVSGTTLNEKFTAFRKDVEKIDGEINDLSRKQSQGIMNGEDEDALNKKLSVEYQKLIERKDNLVTKFICNNFDSPLAAAAFQYITIPILMQGGMPEKTAWVESIMSKASDEFKNDPYVKFYMEKATYVEGVMNGTIELPNQQQAEPMTQQEQESASTAAPNDVPTANQLAEPKDSVKE